MMSSRRYAFNRVRDRLNHQDEARRPSDPSWSPFARSGPSMVRDACGWRAIYAERLRSPRCSVCWDHSGMCMLTRAASGHVLRCCGFCECDKERDPHGYIDRPWWHL